MTCKGILLEKGNSFMTRYGTALEEEYPSVLFLRTRSRITPTVDKWFHDDEIDEIREMFASFVNSVVRKSKCVDDDYLMSIEMPTKNLRYGKKSYLKYDIYLKPKKKSTIERHMFRMRQLSKKFDKGLEKILKSANIICC